MQRDDSFDLSILQREEDNETSFVEKSVEIPDEDIENLPDIEEPNSAVKNLPDIKNRNSAVKNKMKETPAAVVLPRRAPIAVVPPTSRSVPVPPSSHSVAVPPTTRSVPVPPFSHNVPVSPGVSSVVGRPTSRSIPVPATSHSVPVPPTSRSVPVPPTSRTVPVPPTSHNVPVSPVVSSVVGRPVHLTQHGQRASSSTPPRAAPLVARPTFLTPRAVQTGRISSHPTQVAPLREITTNSTPPRVLGRVPPQFTSPASCMVPSTSKGVTDENRYLGNSDENRKRQHIAIYDSSEEYTSKKAKLDDSDTEPDSENSDYEPDSEDGDEYTLTNDIMPFPRQAEDIDFDVRTLSKLPQKGFDLNSMGDKKYAEFLRQRTLTTECIEDLYNSLKEALKEQEDLPDPRGLRVGLMPHQKQGLKWMKWREGKKPKGGILADDMGLGKTLQVISLVLAEKNERQGTNQEDDESDEEDWGFSKPDKIYDGNTLVVCLASLTRQWEKEVLTKTKKGKLRVYVYHGSTRQISEAKLAKYDIVITTYNHVMQEYELDVAPKRNKDSRLFKIHWQRVVLDEAHYIRNHKSKMSVAACELRSSIRWALTGTPIQNKESDFYALLKFLKVSPFDEWPVWSKWVSNRSSTGNQRLILITKTLMLRRTKSELEQQNLIEKLPEKEVTIIKLHLDKDERIAYQKLLLYSQSFFNEFLRQRKDKEHLKEFGCHMRPTGNLIAQEVPDKISKMLKLLMRHHKDDIGTHYILVLILRLRQICCHPALIKAMLDEKDLQAEGIDFSQRNEAPNLLAELNKMLSDDEDDDEECDIDASMAKKIMSHANPVFSNLRKSSKVKQILKIVDTILEKGEKVIIVSQWTSFLKVIAKNLQYVDGARYATFSGGVNIKERQLALDRINDHNDRLNILLLSLTAGGVGLNLVGANNLLLVDLHWNPQLETQAQDRIYRFGQQNDVHIYKFICVDTIEEKIKKLQDDKLEIAKQVLTGKVNNALTIEDLKLLFS